MKKLFVTIAVLSLMLAGCGTDNESSSTTASSLTTSDSTLNSSENSQTAETSSNNATNEAEGLMWKVEPGSVDGNLQSYYITMWNATDQYFDGAFQLQIRREEDTQIYDTVLPAGNVEPNGLVTAIAYVPLDMKLDNINQIEINPYRETFSDTPVITPELSYEELYKYLIPEYQLFEVDGDQQSMTATIYNTSTRYFTGTITVVVMDADSGDLLGYKDIDIKNLSPGDYESVLFRTDVASAYQWQLAIAEEYQITEEPIT